MKKTVNKLFVWFVIFIFGSVTLGMALWLLGFIWTGVLELWSALL
ncbi:hypothetical protein [Carnobacterium mobile]|nr:hypothetical protein [Carnobacterium mobile]